jgi:hypothetical protein
VLVAFESRPRLRFVLAATEAPPSENAGPRLRENEPNSPAGVLTAVVFGVSYETELSLVDADEAAEEALLAATWRLLMAFGAIGETTTLWRIRRELDLVDFGGFEMESETMLSSRSSSFSEELATKPLLSIGLPRRVVAVGEVLASEVK